MKIPLPEWNEAGEPVNLAGAAQDALEWLEWVQRNRVPMPDDLSIRLTGAINALYKHLRIPDYQKAVGKGVKIEHQEPEGVEIEIRDVDDDGVRARYFRPLPNGFCEITVSQRRLLSEKATGGERWEPAKIHWPDLPGKFIEIAEPFAAAIVGAIETAKQWNAERS